MATIGLGANKMVIGLRKLQNGTEAVAMVGGRSLASSVEGR